MRTGSIALAGALALAGSALVAAPAQAETLPSCTFHVSTKPSGVQQVTVQGIDVPDWMITRAVVSSTGNGRAIRALDPATQTLTLNMARLDMPFISDVWMKSKRDPAHGNGALDVRCSEV